MFLCVNKSYLLFQNMKDLELPMLKLPYLDMMWCQKSSWMVETILKHCFTKLEILEKSYFHFVLDIWVRKTKKESWILSSWNISYNRLNTGINKQVPVYLHFVFAGTFYSVPNKPFKANLHCENRQSFISFMVSKHSRHIRIHWHQWKHQSHIWNLFKVNNKDIRTTSLTSLVILLLTYYYIYYYILFLLVTYYFFIINKSHKLLYFYY